MDGKPEEGFEECKLFTNMQETSATMFTWPEIKNYWNTTKTVKEECKSLSRTPNETVLYFLLIDFLAIKLDLIEGA